MLDLKKWLISPKVKKTIPHRGSGRDRRFDGIATVDCAIYPQNRGRVYFRGSWWFAKCDRELVFVPGDRVQVIGVEEITLLVQPLIESN